MDNPIRHHIFITDTGTYSLRNDSRVWPPLQLMSVAQKNKPIMFDHVVLQYPIHRPRHWVHGLTVLDDETIEWLLNTCPKISCGQTVVWKTRAKDEGAIELKPRQQDWCDSLEWLTVVFQMFISLIRRFISIFIYEPTCLRPLTSSV